MSLDARIDGESLGRAIRTRLRPKLSKHLRHNEGKMRRNEAKPIAPYAKARHPLFVFAALGKAMRNVLLVGLLLGCAALPAHAGERHRPALKNAASAIATSASFWSARDKRAPERLQSFMLPAASTHKPPPRLTLLAESAPKRVAMAAPTRWGPGSTLPQVTARAGASYAVDDVMNAQPKPRRRGSALSAALVLRLDGQDDSPAFSVGGGGVAAAVWRAVPK